MTIQANGSKYEGFFEYLKSEQPEFYNKFRRHYPEKRGSYPEMTERQYLLLMAAKIGNRARTKLAGLDDNLINEDEIKKFKEMINASPKLQQIVEDYHNIKRIGSKLETKYRRELKEAIADKLYNNLGKKEKKRYSRKQVNYILPKLNLGPWKMTRKNYSGESLEEFLIRNRDLFDGRREECAIKIYEAAYNTKVETAKTFEDAREEIREILKSLTIT